MTQQHDITHSPPLVSARVLPDSMLQHALEYADANWSIFPVCSPSRSGTSKCHEGHQGPCTNPGKIPLVRWSVAQDSLADEKQITAWWRRWPSANIGLATGALSKVCVIDIDNGTALAETQRRGMPCGPSVATGRVGGRHLYCAWRDSAPTVFARASGIDFRGEGGYVVLPPSRHKTGVVYTWTVPPTDAELPALPGWIDQMATMARNGEERGHVSIGRLFADGVPEGERDITLFRVAAKLRAVDVPEDVAVGVLLELAARCRPPFERDQAVLKIESAYRRYKPSPLRDRQELPTAVCSSTIDPVPAERVISDELANV